MSWFKYFYLKFKIHFFGYYLTPSEFVGYVEKLCGKEMSKMVFKNPTKFFTGEVEELNGYVYGTLRLDKQTKGKK